MAALRTRWIPAFLVLGFAVVLAAPALLFWKAIQAEPLNARTVLIGFQNVRFEAGGLVFRYSVRNTTQRRARFLSDSHIRALQPSGRPPVGYANLKLPLELPAESVQQVEIRLELPGTRSSMRRGASDEQTKMVLEQPMPIAPPDGDPPLSPLPMRGRVGGNENPPAPPPSFSLDEFLTDLQGFELTDPDRGVKLVFPRGW